jgi:hypothetical protein
MSAADETREKAIIGTVRRVIAIANENADKGFNSVDLGDYADVDLSDKVVKKLEAEGYSLDADTLSW